MQYLTLKEYLNEARNIVRKSLPHLKNDEETVSFVAYEGMMADKRFDMGKVTQKISESTARRKFRVQSYIFAIKKLVYNYNKNKDLQAESIYDIAHVFDLKSNITRPDIACMKKEMIDDIFNRTDIISERNLKIYYDYSINNSSLEEISNTYNVSKQRAHQIIQHTISTLRRHYGTD